MDTADGPAPASGAASFPAAARGRFITLEGLEGVGKTTNGAFVAAALRAAGHTVLTTREPGGTPLGERLRTLVLESGGAMRPETELLLMSASRIEHVAEVIEPALAGGQWVLCDRFLDASVAYQGGGRELGTDFVARLHAELGVSLAPDLTVLLDMPVADGLARMRERGEPDRIEREGEAFFERARAAYLARAAADPARVVVIDAARPLAAVQASIARALAERLGIGSGVGSRVPPEVPAHRADESTDTPNAGE